MIGERPFDKPTVYQEFLDKKDEIAVVEGADKDPEVNDTA